MKGSLLQCLLGRPLGFARLAIEQRIASEWGERKDEVRIIVDVACHTARGVANHLRKGCTEETAECRSRSSAGRGRMDRSEHVVQLVAGGLVDCRETPVGRRSGKDFGCHLRGLDRVYIVGGKQSETQKAIPDAP